MANFNVVLRLNRISLSKVLCVTVCVSINLHMYINIPGPACTGTKQNYIIIVTVAYASHGNSMI